MAEENMGVEPAPGSPPPGAARLEESLKHVLHALEGVVDFLRFSAKVMPDETYQPINKRLWAATNMLLEAQEAERSGAPEASSPKGPTQVTPELPRAPRAHGEKEGGGPV